MVAPDTPDDAPRWGFMMNRWHDQQRTAHLLRPDNSPACGAAHYASAGMSQDVQDCNKCDKCKRIEKRRLRLADAQKGKKS